MGRPTALMLTVAVAPLSGWLRRRGARARAGTAAAIATVYLILLAVGTAMPVSLTRPVALLPSPPAAEPRDPPPDPTPHHPGPLPADAAW
jgi:hypothetical protein